MKKITVLCTLLLAMMTSYKTFAQFLPQSQQGLTNLVLLNPAAMSIGEEKFEATISNQSILSSISGAPAATFFNAQGTIWHKKGDNYLSIGTVISNDRIGNFSNLLAQGGAAFHVRNQDHHLSFGLSGGAIRYSFNMQKAVFDNPNEPVAGIGINGSSAIVDFGTYYEFKKYGIFAMASGRWTSGYTVVTENKFPITFGVMIGQKINLTPKNKIENSYVLTYALEIRKENTMSAHLHALISWKDNFWLGTILRAEALSPFTSWGVQTGYRFKAEDDEHAFGIRMAYFFPMGNQLASRYSQGLFEIGLNYQLHKPSKLR